MSGKPFTHAKRRAIIAANVEITESGCWLWQRHVFPTGYGCSSVDGRGEFAHRVSYIVHIGPIPDGLHIDHACHTRDKSCRGGPTCLHRRCVNPSHLEAVPQKVNNERAAASRNTCRPHGHPLDGIRTNGGVRGRYCKTCARDRATDYHARKRAERKAAA